MRMPAVMFGKITHWAGQVWMMVFTAARNTLRTGLARGADPAASLADTLDRQRQRSLSVIAEQVRGLRDGSSGDACNSVTADLSGNRQASLTVLENLSPLLKGIAAREEETYTERVVCRAGRRKRHWFTEN